MADPDDFYEFLGVNKTASGVEIKRAYFKRALQLHPDKNPGDEGAKTRFQQLQHIYSTLSDAAKRADYDRFGPEGCCDDFAAAAAAGDEDPTTWSVEEIERILRAWTTRLTPEEVAARTARARANMKYSPAAAQPGGWSPDATVREAERALAIGVSELRWERLQLASLPGPACVRMGEQIEVLVLDKNALEVLPPELARLTKLRVLGLEENRFCSFPAPILELPELRELNLSHNHIKEVPEGISRLSKLAKLLLFANDIETVPGALVTMTNLVHLDLECNFIRALPPGLRERSELALHVDPELASQLVPASRKKKAQPKKKKAPTTTKRSKR